MQYDVETPEGYLSVQEDDWRLKTLNTIRTLIHQHGPELVEGINYKMLSYSDKNGVVFHLNSQKNYVSFYVGTASKIDPTGELLKGINVGKGCIRFSKSVVVADTQFESFIIKAITLRQQNVNIDC